MNSEITSQYVFKINEAKLKQDLKITESVRNSLENYAGNIRWSLENEMISSCQKYKRDSKEDFDVCVKENGKKVEGFKAFSKEMTELFLSQYYGCRQKLKLMGYKAYDKQAFHLIVDLEDASNKTWEQLEMEAIRTKANEWRK